MARGLLLLSLFGAFGADAFSVDTADGTICANPEPKQKKPKTEAEAGCTECLEKAPASKNISDLKIQAGGIKKDVNFSRDLAFFRAMKMQKTDEEDPVQIALEDLQSHKRTMARHQTYFSGPDAELYSELQNIANWNDSPGAKELAAAKILIQKIESVVDGKIKNFLKSKPLFVFKTDEDSEDAIEDFDRILKSLRSAQTNLRKALPLLSSPAKYDAGLVQGAVGAAESKLDTIEKAILQTERRDLEELEKDLAEKKFKAAKAKIKDNDEKDYQAALVRVTAKLPASYDKAKWNCGLTPAEVFALVDYTESGFEKLNKALRSPPVPEKYRLYRDVLNTALTKIKIFSGEVKRGAESLPEKVLAQHKPGKTVTYQAFTSTSKDSGFSGAVQFVIKSRTGRYIAPLSSSESEEEVLFPTGSRFKILKTELQEPIDKYDDEESKKEKRNRIKIIMEEVK